MFYVVDVYGRVFGAIADWWFAMVGNTVGAVVGVEGLSLSSAVVAALVFVVVVVDGSRCAVRFLEWAYGRVTPTHVYP